MRRHLLLSALFPFVILGCPSETPAVCDNGACDQTDGGNPDSSSGGDSSNPDGVAPPEGCDPNADPKDAPKCVVSDFGIFVDAATGNDGNSGSKELPVKTFAGAFAKLNGRPRIYVCEGTYPESVKLTSPISIYGGFACGTWTYTGVQPKIAPGVAGVEALLIENVKSRIVVSDVHAEAAAGDATKKNSIAVRIVASGDVKLVRIKATASAGFEGAGGTAGTTGQLDKLPGGSSATGATPGAAKVCTCDSGGTTSGGGGGANNVVGQPGGDPLLPANPAGSDGAGGQTGMGCTAVEPNGSGNTGATAPPAADAPKPTVAGSIVDGKWVAGPGVKGSAGVPGQGGGGGAGNTNGGGGGACGGCGGTGGGGGEGGGASISLLVIDSGLALANSALVAGVGGTGGSGGPGGAGGAGGVGGGGTCGGGDGGGGGKGGAGSGGFGGISVGILWKGTEPVRDDATVGAITIGSGGQGGQGGTPGMNDGPDGAAEKVMGL